MTPVPHPTMMLTLAQELVLVATDEDGSISMNASLDNGIAGARLLELALAGRITLADGKIAVADATPSRRALA